MVTQFTPPQGIDPLLAADFLGRPEKGPSALLAYLVVEDIAQLYAPEGEQRPGPERDNLSSFEARSLAREIQLTWVRDKAPSELRYVTRSMLGSPGKTHHLSQVYSSADYAKVWEIRQDRVLSAGLRRGLPLHGPLLFFGFLGLLGYGVFQVWNGLAGLGWWFLLAGILGTMLLLVAVHLVPTLGPLTKKGRDVRRELLGLERFVMLAEKDRIAWLQNIRDAPRDGDRVRLYEKLLPWAIVFGAERSWAKVAGEMHDQFPDVPAAPDLAWLSTANSIRTEYDRHLHQQHHSWWDTRSDIGRGPTANAARDFSSWYRSREHDSRRSSGGGWSGGGGGGSSFSGGSSGSSGGGFSGGGIGGGGGGRW